MKTNINQSSRRNFLKLMGMGALTVALSPFKNLTAQDNNKPNVLFIVCDDLNDWISPMNGYPGVKTPNFERLAKRGVTFTNCFCNAPACNPSRKSFLSGMRPSTTGLYYNNLKIRDIMPDAVTLPQHFRNNGYHVRGGGKIFHTFNQGDALSWDEYLDLFNSPHPEPYPLPRVSGHRDHEWAPLDISDKEMEEDFRTVTWASEFLDEKHDGPFFLGVGTYKPHHPWVVPKKYFEMYPLDKIKLPVVKEDDVDDLPEYGKYFANKREPQLLHRKIVEANQWKLAIHGYLATITYTDAQIGRLLDALDGSQYKDNTIIVLFSDNGMHLGEKEHWTKWGLWEKATKVPLLVSVPGLTKPGTRCEEPVSLIDIYPTLIDLCNLPTNNILEGTSFLPQLKNPTAPREIPVISTHGQHNHAVRTQRWRYIRYRDGGEELYNHHDDPNEWNNLANDPKFMAIKEELRKWLPKVNVPDIDYKESKKYRPDDPTIKKYINLQR